MLTLFVVGVYFVLITKMFYLCRDRVLILFWLSIELLFLTPISHLRNEDIYFLCTLGFTNEYKITFKKINLVHQFFNNNSSSYKGYWKYLLVRKKGWVVTQDFWTFCKNEGKRHFFLNTLNSRYKLQETPLWSVPAPSFLQPSQIWAVTIKHENMKGHSPNLYFGLMYTGLSPS